MLFVYLHVACYFLRKILDKHECSTKMKSFDEYTNFSN